MTYHIRVRAEFVGYYTVKNKPSPFDLLDVEKEWADNIVEAEHIAKDRCINEIIGNGVDMVFDYDHIHDEKTIKEMFDGEESQ
mgnify:CR=1 FL=1|tara:strand:- start:7953 stop:8201 length:249 start_codon:yes stop_codon:yes gene_type:complete